MFVSGVRVGRCWTSTRDPSYPQLLLWPGSDLNDRNPIRLPLAFSATNPFSFYSPLNLSLPSIGSRWQPNPAKTLPHEYAETYVPPSPLSSVSPSASNLALRKHCHRLFLRILSPLPSVSPLPLVTVPFANLLLATLPFANVVIDSCYEYPETYLPHLHFLPSHPFR